MYFICCAFVLSVCFYVINICKSIYLCLIVFSFIFVVNFGIFTV
jgi:hypothetical protein